MVILYCMVHLILFVILHIIATVNSEVNQEHSDAFTIFTEGCIIPAYPLVGENIQDIVGFPKKTISCSKPYPILNANESHIWIEEEFLEYHNILIKRDFFCLYEGFRARTFIEDIIYESSIQFSDTIEAHHEFVRVECYYLDSKVYDDFFVFNKFETTEDRKDYDKFNVIILGLESVSRMNFLRTMPETAKFLSDRESIQLLGYNKLGDNSYPNLFPLLLGKSFEDTIKFCSYGNNTIDANVCGFIWDQYKGAGYVAALGSDSIAGLLGQYEYGLGRMPVDYYLQPFVFESRKLFQNKEYNFHMCYQNKFYYKTLLDYVHNLSKHLKNNNLFGMFWEESVSHEQLNYPHIMDSDYLNLLEKMEISGYLNDSVIIFLSDHGMRWGKIVLTEQGRLEERLPLVEILLPPKFRQKFKLAYLNLKTNSRRLTTPYDMYATLADLIDPTLLTDQKIKERSEKEKYKSKSSLFVTLPRNRTCDFVGVSAHWCTCYRGKVIAAGHRIKAEAAKFMIAHINTLLTDFPQCQKLSLKNILGVSAVRDTRGGTYRVAIEASPGGGIFDSTLRRERGLWAVSGTISRLNLYRGQSDCVENMSIKMYCYCHSN